MSRKPHPKQVNKPGRRWREPGFLLPAVEAIIIQVLAVGLLYALLLLADTVFDRRASIGVAMLMQGTLAMLITWWRRLPIWWLPIQFFFPIALLLAHTIALSPVVYLVVFLLLVLVYWTPFKTRVPLYLSGESIWEKVAAFLPKDAPVRFADVGSGVGGLALHLAERFPKASITGIELAPFPWLISWIRGRIRHNRARFVWGNYHNVDFSQFDIVFTFLSPAAMASLWEKASSDMQQDSLLLSYEFIIPHVKPDIVIPASSGDAALYGWRITKEAFEKQRSSS